ncbi:MAG: hypothetical protein HKO59_07600, partial [Phycisphaerales bacterium]|nr:hypothetical protein [Phycisphaerales bacterium]
GLPGIFRVELLPEGAHPLDVRYNVIHWVHRATRGWSYGGYLTDPRTGEIVRGNVLLGSLRVRQDRMIFEGLVGAEQSGTGGANDPIQTALARIRQLAAHEVGHAIGLAHNMAASTQSRASVMDYPAPEVAIDERGELDLSDAYAVGVGAWDRLAIRALYGNEDPEAVMRDGIARGLIFVGDAHSRAGGSGHPEGALWDTGSDSVESLRHQMRVRRLALERFAERALPDGRPRAELRERLVPIYLFHRYQAEAAAKKVGGIRFNYGTATDGSSASTIVPANEQWAALDAVLDCVTPEALDLPDELVAMLDPHEPNLLLPGVSRELFRPTLDPAFDVTSAADAGAAIVLGALLHHDRLARIDELFQRDPGLPSLDAVLDRVVERLTGGASPRETRADVLRRTTQWRVFRILASLSSDPHSKWRVRAAADRALESLEARWKDEGPGGTWLRGQAERFRERPEEAGSPAAFPVSIPPGSPIGACGR